MNNRQVDQIRKVLGGLVMSVLAGTAVPAQDLVSAQVIQRPDEYAWLHDSAIVAFKDKLFAAWYNCPVGEMVGSSVIRGRISDDGGKTWGDVRCFVKDPKWLYVPPAFGTDGASLWMYVSRMSGPDRVHDCEGFLWNERDGRFEKKMAFGVPFLPNTPASRIAGGRWIIGGRVSVQAGECPLTPCVAISEGPDLGGAWKIVRITPAQTAPNGKEFVIPETGLAVDRTGRTVFAFVRSHADPDVGGYLYVSRDAGQSWSAPRPLPLALEPVKMTAGLLSNGLMYLMGNPSGCKRERLFVYCLQPETLAVLGAREIRPASSAGTKHDYHYPAAWEAKGMLHVVFTTEFAGESGFGAAHAAIPVADFQTK